MSPPQRVLRTTLSFLLALLAGSVPDYASGQNFSGLQDKELRPLTDVQSGAQSILGGLLKDTPAGSLLGGTTGKIDRVVVADDRERRLAVRVTCSGLAGKQLQGELRGSNRRPQREFRPAQATVGPESNEVELVFEVPPSVPEGTELQSPFLYLKVLRPGLPLPELERAFELGKRWKVGIKPENLVIRITPQPEGAAAQLKEEEVKVVLPPASVLTLAEPVSARAIRATAMTEPSARISTSAVRGEAAVAASERAATVSPSIAAMSLDKRVLLEKTEPAARALPPNKMLVAVANFRFGVPEEDKNRGAKGPGGSRIDLLEGVRSDISLLRESVIRMSPEVYQDQNPTSGIFYFIPSAYHVDWRPDEGYGMRMLYSASTREGQAGDVLMSMRLDARVDTREVQFAKELMNAYKARHPETSFTELRPLPIDKPPEVSLAGGLQRLYNIPPEKIATVAISQALGQIDISWITDTITKENLQLALTEDVGINGNLAFTASGGGLPPPNLPVQIRLADVGTFGEFRWRRGEKWRNPTPYPLRLKYLHALLLENNTPIIYSWNLGNKEVAPAAQVEFDGSPVPSWIDGKAKRLWLDYAVVSDCNACDQQVISAITGGVTSLGASQITFSTITPLADTGAYQLTAQVRSKYFDPRNRESQQKPELPLNADGKDFTVGPIYLVNRQDGQSIPGDPLFEYFLTAVMRDGTIYRATRWIPSDNLRVVIGRVQVEQALGSLPAVNPGAVPTATPATVPTPPSSTVPTAPSGVNPTPTPTPQ